MLNQFLGILAAKKLQQVEPVTRPVSSVPVAAEMAPPLPPSSTLVASSVPPRPAAGALGFVKNAKLVEFNKQCELLKGSLLNKTEAMKVGEWQGIPGAIVNTNGAVEIGKSRFTNAPAIANNTYQIELDKAASHSAAAASGNSVNGLIFLRKTTGSPYQPIIDFEAKRSAIQSFFTQIPEFQACMNPFVAGASPMSPRPAASSDAVAVSSQPPRPVASPPPLHASSPVVAAGLSAPSASASAEFTFAPPAPPRPAASSDAVAVSSQPPRPVASPPLPASSPAFAAGFSAPSASASAEFTFSPPAPPRPAEFPPSSDAVAVSPQPPRPAASSDAVAALAGVHSQEAIIRSDPTATLEFVNPNTMAAMAPADPNLANAQPSTTCSSSIVAAAKSLFKCLTGSGQSSDGSRSDGQGGGRT